MVVKAKVEVLPKVLGQSERTGTRTNLLGTSTCSPLSMKIAATESLPVPLYLISAVCNRPAYRFSTSNSLVLLLAVLDAVVDICSRWEALAVG